jgi:hydroxymethylpyrimidine pyrophosphatase-like HAD family hydrolase
MVHQLAAEAWSEYHEHVRVLNHHLGVDVIPSGWSKANATQNFLSYNQIRQEEYSWYVFGDNQSDREMCQGLDHVSFIDTKQHASTIVKKTLDQLLL